MSSGLIFLGVVILLAYLSEAYDKYCDSKVEIEKIKQKDNK